MPVIPVRGAARPIQDISLGRVQAEEVPGIQEGVRLQQMDELVKSGASFADRLLKRQETKKKEDDDLVVNESVLAFEAGSRQKKLELEQRRGVQTQGIFLEFKQAQDKLWDEAVSKLTPSQTKLFEAKAAPIGLGDNAQMARLEAASHQKRIDANFAASSAAAKLRAFDFLTDKKAFDKNIKESVRLNDELLKRQGIGDTERETTGKKLLSSSVAEGIVSMSAISNPRAESWLNQAIDDGELTTQDAIKVRSALDKRGAANKKVELLNWSQANADKLISSYGEDRTAIYEQIEKQTSGEQEVALKKEVNIRLNQIKDQNAENQRELLKTGKRIIDQALNAMKPEAMSLR